jgi:hypothetical protein
MHIMEELLMTVLRCLPAVVDLLLRCTYKLHHQAARTQPQMSSVFMLGCVMLLLLLQIKEEPMDGEEPAAAAAAGGDADSSSPGELAAGVTQLQHCLLGCCCISKAAPCLYCMSQPLYRSLVNRSA